MLFIDKIIPLYFLIVLFIGFFIIYISVSPPKVIYKYPTPDNKENLVFKDKINKCYKYETTNVTCPNNVDQINNLPVQI